MRDSTPNLLLLITDQQRWDTLHALGNSTLVTPNLDRLVSGGTAFTSAYCASPVCVPSRGALMYGRYPLRTGCLENDSPMPQDGSPSLMDLLSERGYVCHGVGKRHFTPDAQDPRGFHTLDRQEELPKSLEGDDYLQYLQRVGFAHAIEPHGVRGESYYLPQLSLLPPEHHPTQWVADRSVDWLHRQAAEGGGRPFFLYSSFIHPHPPFSPPTPWHKLYRAPDMPLPRIPDDPESLWIYTNRLQNRYKGRDTGRDINLIRNIIASYYACISFIDFQVGRLLDTLEALGEMDNTLVIFTSDHGEFLGQNGCFGKRSFLDAAARVPLVCRYPDRFTPGAVCDTPVSLVDILPTLLTPSGNAPEILDGVDLAAVAAGELDRGPVFGHYQQAEAGIYMAVDRDWKYMYSAPDRKEFLFDRQRDPQETRNRAYNVIHREDTRRMRHILQDHIRSYPTAHRIVDGQGWTAQPPVALPDDPDAGLIQQDPEWALDRMAIPGYLSPPAFESGGGSDFNPTDTTH